jgi:hypothetical protein
VDEPTTIKRKMDIEEAYRKYQEYCETFPPQRWPMFTFSGWLGHYRIELIDSEGKPWGG